MNNNSYYLDNFCLKLFKVSNYSEIISMVFLVVKMNNKVKI